MFQHSRSVSFIGDPTAQNMNVLKRGHHQNENLIHRGNQQLESSATTKNNHNYISSDTIMGGNKQPMKNLSKTTPSGKKASTRRRAFGDISNKKANGGGGFGKESSSAKRNPQQNDVLKPRSNNSLLPRGIRNVLTPQNARFAILPEQTKSTRLEGSLNQAINNRNTISQQSPLSSRQHPSARTTAQQVKRHPPLKLEPVPDIERPAGRTWKQQLEYDLKGEDDIASISTIDNILNLESCFSPQDRWRKERDLHWKHQKEKDDEEDRQVQEQIQAIMDREQKEAEEGLDSLYDAIDNLEIFSDSCHDIIKQDDLQGEEWTTPDLSGFDLSLSDDDDLSFPL
jgi:hypothetical protein